MKDGTSKNPDASANPGVEATAPNPELQTRRQLAEFIDVPYKHLTFVLYKLDRAAAYRPIEIAKRSGGFRMLHAVNQPWKGLQRQALEKLQAKWKPTAYAHGFVEGKSILTNAAYHSRAKRIVKVDIKDFFPSINFARVQGMFCAPPFNFGKEVSITLAQLACVDGGQGELPQGGVLSPYISNMICRRLDQRLAYLAREHRCRFTRYADDIAFSTNDVKKFDADTLLESIYEVIASEKFQPNRTKTRVLTPRDRQIVTGIVVNKGLNVNRKYLRNVRATIWNCEKEGIDSQVVKQSDFKDERNSRVRVMPGIGGFKSGDEVVSRGDAARHFLGHVWGKLKFIGSVVESNGQFDDPGEFGRVRAYERLVERFFLLIDRDPRFGNLRQAVIREIRRHPRVDDRLRQRGERSLIRAKALQDYRSKPSTVEMTRRVEAVEDRNALNELVAEFAINAPRFFHPTLPPDFEDAQRKIIRLLSFPPFDRQCVYGLFESMMESRDGLGMLAHLPSDPGQHYWYIAGEASRVLASKFDPVFYSVPYELRDLFSAYIDALEEIISTEGPEFTVDVPQHEGLYTAAVNLKASTRFTRSPESDDGTSMRRLIAEVIKDVRAERAGRDTPSISPRLSEISLYTCVTSVRYAVAEIVRSMLKNSHGKNVDILVESLEDHKVYELVIKDDAMEPIEGDPGRGFVHGKLTQAIKLTDGICEYWVEADFTKRPRAVINMHTGLAGEAESRFDSGFVHRLRFDRNLGVQR